MIHPDEWTVVMSKCISDEGWPVEMSPDGGITFLPVPADQEAEKQAAQERCSQWYPVDPRYRQPLTYEQLEILYRWHVDVAIPCLEDRGFTGFNPPTLERYIETYLTQHHWAPYGDIDSQLTQRHDEWYQVNEECPADPGRGCSLWGGVRRLSGNPEDSYGVSVGGDEGGGDGCGEGGEDGERDDGEGEPDGGGGATGEPPDDRRAHHRPD